MHGKLQGPGKKTCSASLGEAQLRRGAIARLVFRWAAAPATFFIHRLVARAFLGPCLHLQQWVVHHIDGDPSNNCVSNLEYVTPAMNAKLSYAGQRKSNAAAMSKAVMARYCNSADWARFASMSAASRALGVNSGSISKCCHGQTTSASGYEFKLCDASLAPAMEEEVWRDVGPALEILERLPGQRPRAA